MISFRIHGRGGQGAIAASELIALAAFHQGFYAQSLPFFGVERSGAPVQAYVRISDRAIITHSQVKEPDYLIIQDDTLITVKDVYLGLNPKTKILINSQETSEILRKKIRLKIKNNDILTVNASQIALNIMRRNIINTSLLGAFSAHYNLLSKENCQQAIIDKFSKKGRGTVKLNQKIFLFTYDLCQKNANN
ncbi:MAG: pyruvate ferredoxin oxidoreductase [Clostridia bacterium]|nr:pyruvate ferredoxin oxidoreductase [Clostridia bacterium]